ncbi:alpha/beta fold hydrolase [Rufibacter glacialis]|uniref:Alpha/beta fold hydrolase n=1 Tax=Rufibacter glacialis TaxID=1259555 RepID=A0A5M8QBJ1_9BACT|nr:alpha/beta fold hydrolase [Rufibacter glacialis]KAA6433329.1 alpha/beta fold hydrolase [Rufibacter glacialis]GGK75359.1 alpha/beta hydrolase [Rufibacter glacialis]
MELNYKLLGEGQPLLILHGLFGTLDNWQTLGREFSKTYQVYLIDLRNHGRSPHSEEFSYQLMTDDILEFIEQHQLQAPMIIGHSMGGKVAMNFALQHPDQLSKLLVADIAPKYYPPHHDDILEGFRSIDLASIQNRQEADDQLAVKVSDYGTRQFLLKNLYRQEDNSFGWRLNLDAIERNLDQVLSDIVSETPFTKPTLFLRGSNSRYIKPEQDLPQIQALFPQATIQTIENAGHWLHAEQPQEFYRLAMEFLQA